MREIRTEIEIKAGAQEVWAVLTDFASYPQWNPFIQRAEGEITEGARLRVRIEPPGGMGMTFKPTITRVRDAEELRWLGHLFVPGIFDGEHIFEIREEGASQVRFQQRERFRGILVPLFWRSLDQKTRRGFELMNEALKKRVEERTTANS